MHGLRTPATPAAPRRRIVAARKKYDVTYFRRKFSPSKADSYSRFGGRKLYQVCVTETAAMPARAGRRGRSSSLSRRGCGPRAIAFIGQSAPTVRLHVVHLMHFRLVTFRRCLLLACAALCTGCAGSSWSLPLVRLARPHDASATVVVSDAPSTERRQPMLSPSESAEICLTAAREMEAHDRDRAAIEQYERARMFQPKQPGVAKHLAVLYQREGELERAEKEFTAAVNEEPLDADVWNDMATFRFQRGEFAESAEAAREAIELAPDHKRAWVSLGMALAEQDKFEESYTAFEKAAGAAAAHQNLGIILARKGRGDDSRRELTEARRLDPTLRAPPTTAADPTAQTNANSPSPPKQDPRK